MIICAQSKSQGINGFVREGGPSPCQRIETLWNVVVVDNLPFLCIQLVIDQSSF